MTEGTLDITMVNIRIPITLPPPKWRPKSRASQPETEELTIEIHSDSCRIWAPWVRDLDCAETFEFDPAKRGRLYSKRSLVELPHFQEVLAFLTGHYAANRANLLGAFLRPMLDSMERDLAERDGACVYFAQAEDRVKIGWSRKVASRLAQLQTGCPSPLTLLGVMPGARTAERQLHERFAHLRLSGEWFQAAPDLLDHIAQAVR